MIPIKEAERQGLWNITTHSQQHEYLPAMGRTEDSLGSGNPKHNSPADTQVKSKLENSK